MSFDIDPRELDLQGADGMQLVRLLRRLIAEEGGGGGDEPVPSDVSDFFYCTYDVTTYSEIHNALTENKIPVCPLDGHYYYLVSTTQSRYTFACYNNVNHSIMCVRCASSGWDTVTFLPQEKLTWDYAPTQGSTNPVTSGGVYTAIKNNTVDPEDIEAAVDAWLDAHSSTIGGLSYEAKQALMDCFENVAWIDDDGQDYYDALYDALFGSTPVTPTLDSISAVFNQGSAVIYDDATLDSLRQYLTVTAHYSDSTSQVITTYLLSGTLTAGQSVITASYQGQLATFTVNVTARATLMSISAVFTQGSAIIYDTDNLDTLRQYLVVTATYSDSTTATVTDYTLSGTLAEGTSTITVSYGGKADTFTVTVTHALLPSEYKQIQYILRQSGTGPSRAYNTLNVELNGTDPVEIRAGFMASAKQSSSYGYIVACRISNSENSVGFGLCLDLNTTTINAFDGTLCTISPNSGASIRNTRYDVIVNKTSSGLSITDGTNSNSVTTTPRTMGGSLYLFGNKAYDQEQVGYAFYGRIYYVTVFQGGIKVADVVPCKRISDDAVGWYDTVQQTFRYSAYYTAGPDVE